MRRKYFPVAVWLLALAAAIVVLAHARFTTDMSAFLPRSPTSEQRVLVDQLRDGPVSRVLLVGIQGASPETLAVLSKSVAAALRNDARFTSVHNGDNGELSADGRYLWANRYLLSPDVTPNRFSAAGLRQALQNDLEQLGSATGMEMKQSLAADPTGEMLGLVNRLTPETHPAMRDGVWVSPNGARALLVAETRAAGFDIDAQQQAIAAIQTAFDAARAQNPNAANATLQVSGPGMFALHGRDTMKRDTSRFSTLASVLVAGLLLMAYRRPALLVLALLPVASGILVGIAAVAIGFGTVHGITLGFGVTLIGEAVDYAIYYFTYAGARKDLSRLWPTLILGMTISVAGFAAMLFSSFSGFAQLGLFTMAGLVTALLVTRFVLPVFPARPLASPAMLAGRPLELLAAHANVLKPVVLALALAASVTLALHHGLWESDISSLSPASPADTALNQSLRRDLAAPDLRYLAIATAADEQTALELAEDARPVLDQAVKAGDLAHYDSPASILPGIRMQMARQAAIPIPDVLKANLDEASRGLPFKPGLFAPFLADMEKARIMKPVESASLENTGLDMKVRSLLIHNDDGWTAIIPLYGVRPDYAGPGAPFEIVDLKQMSNQLLAGYQHEAMTLALCGSAAVVALLAVAVRSVRRVVFIIAPLAAAVAVTAALFATAQHALTLFNLFGLLLTVAVGSNYCLFFERQCSEYETRPFSALALANLCTVIGFGVLSFSGIPVLRGIGGTVAVGAFLSLVFGAVLIGPRRATP